MKRRQGFTLVEMLVVIGIIVALIAIAIPAISKAYTRSVGVRMKADLQIIATALEGYKADFKDYPRYDRSVPATPTSATSGAALLCWALIAPGDSKQDGHDGPGFIGLQTGVAAGKPIGTVSGPYISIDAFKVYDTTVTSQPATPQDKSATLNDRYGHPILYFNTNKGANKAATNGFISNNLASKPFIDYDANKNVPGVGAGNQLFLNAMQDLLGDSNRNGKLDPTETPTFTGDYVLWSAGPDEKYGYPDTGSAQSHQKLDDATSLP